ncbi:DUF3089 domain-containing protein [Streptomyces paludis]|uniref:DUF3089 domain-containing protein n=1 Tax=Streptomyces paludis TaxID=2282738 RepID=A0A345HZM7_9ACTN|nr:DUF3089 domain-containing protein [Streptomyces paludis]AXG82151.1 DUF3089 domain-containing protein [Streptomyces paludis]
MPRKDMVRRVLIPVAALLAAVLPATAARAAPTEPEPAARPSAAASAATAAAPLARTVWLCRPGLPDNACGQDAAGRPTAPGGELLTRYPNGGATRLLDDTRYAPDGSSRRVPFTVTGTPPVDCFYAYPTVDLLPNPLLQTGSLPPLRENAHQAVTLTQAARFAGLCRLFVPVYRQVPLTGLLGGIILGTDADLTTANADIQQAWDTYWTQYNRDPVTGERRGVVILGHSQGTATAAALLQTRFDGRPEVRRQLVSAVLLGGGIEVPEGRDSGGGTDPDSTFQHLPACHRGAGDPLPVGCVVSYSSYALPAGSLPFAIGRTAKPGHRVVCVNPAALLRGASAGARTPLDLHMPTRRLVGGTALLPGGHLTATLSSYQLPVLPTAFAHHPDAIEGECRHATDASGSADWLQISGDLSHFPDSAPTGLAGLHVVDFNVALGDLVALTTAQAHGWLAGARG